MWVEVFDLVHLGLISTHGRGECVALRGVHVKMTRGSWNRFTSCEESDRAKQQCHADTLIASRLHRPAKILHLKRTELAVQLSREKVGFGGIGTRGRKSLGAVGVVTARVLLMKSEHQLPVT